MEEILQQQLEHFSQLHCPGTSLSIDDVVLSYLSEIICSLSHEDSEVDETSLTDIIAAHIPEFGAIDSKVTCDWVHTLVLMCSEQGKTTPNQMVTLPQQTTTPITPPQQTTTPITPPQQTTTPITPPQQITTPITPPQQTTTPITLPWQKTTPITPPQQTTSITLPQQTTTSITPQVQLPLSPRKPILDKQVTVLGVAIQSNAPGAVENSAEGQVSPDQVALVADIFPGVSQERIRRTLHCCQGNIDECVQILLDGSERSHTQSQQEEKCTVESPDCAKLKAFITSRYGLVDTKDDVITHKPVEPKWEGKKMVRYRDNHVVSTKGERYLVETKNEGNQSNTKASYIRPLRKYRFH